MTNTVESAREVYGMKELRGLYRKYAAIGLTISAAIHFALIGGYFAAQYFGEEEEPVMSVRILKYSELGPPPSITNTEAAPQVSVSVPVARPTVGVPVPVPDAEVSPEQTIATQQEMSAVQSPVGEGTGGGEVHIEQDISVEEPPAEFVPVEKQPVPVKTVQPEYPDIARRAGVEGKVWVKIWVDKEGKPRRADIIKSDAEIFNEPAKAAAMQFLFTPAMMNNGPVAVWVSIPFVFKLNK
jgi:protein TonB